VSWFCKSLARWFWVSDSLKAMPTLSAGMPMCMICALLNYHDNLLILQSLKMVPIGLEVWLKW
jgi:hypothetical protein